MEVKHSCN